MYKKAMRRTSRRIQNEATKKMKTKITWVISCICFSKAGEDDLSDELSDTSTGDPNFNVE